MFFPYTPLEPRDVLFGGGTSPSCLFKQIKGEKMCYVDFISLYPYVQKRGKYPAGHPQILINDECGSVNVKDIFGLIKCNILPPRNLYFTVLTVCVHEKLFPLCYTCAAANNLERCDHSENQRSIMGTWTSIEINKAIEKGYPILNIYEIFHYSKQFKNM